MSKDHAANPIRIVRNLLQIGVYLQKIGNRLTSRFGLTQPQFVVLNEIVERGPVNHKHIVGELLFEKSNVSKIAKKLQTMGLIQGSMSTDDGRSTILAATPKGRRVWSECLQCLNAWAAERLGSLKKTDQEVSVRMLQNLNHQLTRDE